MCVCVSLFWYSVGGTRSWEDKTHSNKGNITAPSDLHPDPDNKLTLVLFFQIHSAINNKAGPVAMQYCNEPLYVNAAWWSMWVQS